MLQNAYFLAKIGADTAENEQHFAEIWPEWLHLRLRIRARLDLRAEERMDFVLIGPIDPQSFRAKHSITLRLLLHYEFCL